MAENQTFPSRPYMSYAVVIFYIFYLRYSPASKEEVGLFLVQPVQSRVEPHHLVRPGLQFLDRGLKLVEWRVKNDVVTRYIRASGHIQNRMQQNQPYSHTYNF